MHTKRLILEVAFVVIHSVSIVSIWPILLLCIGYAIISLSKPKSRTGCFACWIRRIILQYTTVTLELQSWPFHAIINQDQAKATKTVTVAEYKNH